MLLFQGHCYCKLKLQLHCTKIYPIPLILAPLLWGEYCPSATFPQVLSLFGFPPVPNPILESQLSQTFLLVTEETNSCFGMVTRITHSIEPFPVTVRLQGGL